MTRKELEVANAIFETIRLHENWATKSCNDCWTEVDEVTFSDEQLRRAALEVQNAPTLVTVEARIAFVEIDQNCEPARTTVTETKQDYDVALHQRGPEMCGHFTADQLRRCELKAPEKEPVGTGDGLGITDNAGKCPVCGSPYDEVTG